MMPSYLTLLILFLVVLFLLLAFAVAVTLVTWGLRERETEWPADWRTPSERAEASEAAAEEREERREAEAASTGEQRIA
jgi:hypothetical protein